MTKPERRIALVPGDGIGIEVAASAGRVLERLNEQHELGLVIDEFDWSCERYLAEGALMPVDGLETLAKYRAVLLGAVGRPDVPDHVSLWGLLIPIRRVFEQYVNLRPVRSFEGIPSPLAGADERRVDFLVVRENNEGEYSEIGGRYNRGLPTETAVQESVFTRHGITRIADYALDLAESRKRRLTSATKSNGLIHTMPFWDEVVRERAAAHPDVDLTEEHVDALAAKLVLRPESLRRDRREQPVRRHPQRPRRRRSPAASASPLRRTWTRPAVTRRCSSRCTARPRHRRQRHRQPGGHAVDGGHDAEPPRRRARRPGGS